MTWVYEWPHGSELFLPLGLFNSAECINVVGKQRCVYQVMNMSTDGQLTVVILVTVGRHEASYFTVDWSFSPISGAPRGI